jgi:hypothetical protein
MHNIIARSYSDSKRSFYVRILIIKLNTKCNNFKIRGCLRVGAGLMATFAGAAVGIAVVGAAVQTVSHQWH